MLALAPTFWRAMTTAYAPVTIVTSSIPSIPETGQEQRFQDWLETLAYMRENLPDNAVVFAWWDYGYWITTLGDKHSLADNGTINSTQISIIAQTFLMNYSQALPTLKKYGVTHVAIFITYQASQTGQGGAQYLGYGEEGKWYWMTRIGNQTRYGNNTVIFQEKRTSGDQRTPNYYRVIMDANRTRVLSNETISEGQVPNDQTLLGLLIKEGTQRRQPGEEPNPFFRLVFPSSNRFVLLYEVKYLKPTHVTLQPLTNLTAKFGHKYVLTGNLTFVEDALPLVNTGVNIQTSNDGGQNWSTFDVVPTNVNGTYSYVWQPNAGAWAVRTLYEGRENEYLGAVSDVQYVVIEKANVSLSVRAELTDVSIGKNVTIYVNFNASVTGGNVTIEYRIGNGTWTKLTSGLVVNGTFNYTWTIPANFTDAQVNVEIRAVWPGNQNYNPATSTTVTIVVRRS
jgi:hypothetical protein